MVIKSHLSDTWVQRAVQGVQVFSRHPDQVRLVAHRLGLPPALVAAAVAYLAQRFSIGAPHVLEDSIKFIRSLEERGKPWVARTP